uniref:Uncharacterized protein n=1 Tax=Arundo donax TaxID=35708 RepID=A0A0A9B2W1_ARUDO
MHPRINLFSDICFISLISHLNYEINY